jgi:hypothetical protein
MPMPSAHTFSPVSLSTFSNDETIFLKWQRFPFHDKRLERLWYRLSNRMAERQSAVIHRISKAWSEMTSFYRFINNKRIQVEEILYHSCKLKHSMGLDVLVLGDSSSYTLDKHVGRIRDAHRLGVVENNKSAGYFVQCMLAVDSANEAVLGMADLLFWNRPKREAVYDDSGKKRRKSTHRMDWKDKETYKWSIGIENTCRALPKAQSITFVFDQGADAYELYKDASQNSSAAKVQLICRANYDRLVVWNDQVLHMSECLSRCEVLGNYKISLPALDHYSTTNKKRVKRQAREASIELRCCAVGLLAPGKTSAAEGNVLPFYLVQARETTQDLPPGEEPLLWRIITNIPTQTFEQAKQIVHYYTRRWMIEQLFRTTKSEGFRLEDTELESVDAIFKQAAMAFQTACKVLQLVYARNRYDAQPIQQVFSEEEIQVLEHLSQEYEGQTLAQKNPFPKNQMSWAAWVIARLGGWKGYASKRPPGPMTMLWGLEKFAVFLHAWKSLQNNPKNEHPCAKQPPQSCTPDVST